MEILFLTNNINTYPLVRWLKEVEGGENLILYEDELKTELIISFAPDIVISYNYKHIIPFNILRLYKEKFVNLHISMLPWNRGAYPNVWSYIDDTPKGVSIHLIDEGIDTGPILLQKEIFIDDKSHTLRSSYELLNFEIQRLFQKHWEEIRSFKIPPRPQVGKGTYHSKKDFEKIKHLLGKEGWDIPILLFKKRIEQWKRRDLQLITKKLS